MQKIMSIISAIFGLVLALKVFGIYDASALSPIDLTLLGALFLLGSQILDYVILHASNKGTTLMAKFIKAVLVLPAIMYFIQVFFSVNFGFDLSIIIALFLFLEGLYGLH